MCVSSQRRACPLGRDEWANPYMACPRCGRRLKLLDLNSLDVVSAIGSDYRKMFGSSGVPTRDEMYCGRKFLANSAFHRGYRVWLCRVPGGLGCRLGGPAEVHVL